jgi:hypothetical protein
MDVCKERAVGFLCGRTSSIVIVNLFPFRLGSRDHREFTPPKTTQYTVNSTFSLNCKVHPYCNDNKKVLPEDDPAGSKHVGVCYD